MEIRWSVYLSMYKYYVKNGLEKDQTYEMLVEIMERLFKEPNVEQRLSGR